MNSQHVLSWIWVILMAISILGPFILVWWIAIGRKRLLKNDMARRYSAYFALPVAIFAVVISCTRSTAVIALGPLSIATIFVDIATYVLINSFMKKEPD